MNLTDEEFANWLDQAGGGPSAQQAFLPGTIPGSAMEGFGALADLLTGGDDKPDTSAQGIGLLPVPGAGGGVIPATAQAVISFLLSPAGAGIAGRVLSALLGRSPTTQNASTSLIMLAQLKNSYPQAYLGLAYSVTGASTTVGLREDGRVAKLVADLAATPGIEVDLNEALRVCGCK